ncbi:uncharacterized protein LOC108811702 [Raphanus sativus]|uniref:Uncharacterized protein LOC108811702 n=1 Tax=Raphanus sativus TaxID=3726 RepID=A0A6J0JUE2_RAPSA|nr:uncharacterized protein LOC108811702 [Raphanus sativus]
MDYEGGFHEVETDGKILLVYHHPKYRPIPQIKNTSSPDEAANQDHPPLPLFLCPVARGRKDYHSTTGNFVFTSSPEYVISTTRVDNRDHHHVLPLFWCNNEKFGKDDGCLICNLNFGTDYYFCGNCDTNFHKECVEAPLKIKHPYYPRHSLELCWHDGSDFDHCSCCGRRMGGLIYHCTVYQTYMHPICAMKSIPVIIDQQKIHVHPLTFFPRQNSLICNVCGLIEIKYATYVCLRCNFVAHIDCMYSPHTIKISRHHHRISYVSSLRYGKCHCGVCRQSIDGDYGAYTCNKCGDYYAVHSRCALGKDVWDGEELEGIPEKDDDITQDAPPFWEISKGVIHYFLHDHHHLRLEENILYDENKLCQACVMPVFEEEIYSCTECDFILHETCLKAGRRIQHALHPHLLILKAINNGSGEFQCYACRRSCGGFVYQCPTEECKFMLDVRCASISEPFDYQGHEHPLFLSLDPEKLVRCEVCKYSRRKLLSCIKCDFIVCIECATLPYKTRYKNDKHFLTLSWRGGEERCENWCEECEDVVGRNLFYWCNDCCTILHTACLFSNDPYMKPGQCFEIKGKEVKILAKSNTSRPTCYHCRKPCQGKIFTTDNCTACSRTCAFFIILLSNS